MDVLHIRLPQMSVAENYAVVLLNVNVLQAMSQYTPSGHALNIMFLFSCISISQAFCSSQCNNWLYIYGDYPSTKHCYEHGKYECFVPPPDKENKIIFIQRTNKTVRQNSRTKSLLLNVVLTYSEQLVKTSKCYIT